MKRVRLPVHAGNAPGDSLHRYAAAPCGNGRQRGAATLIVVMVLFFVMSLVAAYTSRNLIFEQKTSANQLRSTQAAEAAEAGLQWALGLLNSGRVNANCQPSANLADTSFRDRYLFINGETGAVTPIPKAAPLPPLPVAAAAPTLEPSCVFDGVSWNCRCPTAGDTPQPPIPADGAIYPAFRVRFQQHPDPVNRGQLVRIEVNGCTAYLENCLKFAGGSGTDNEGRAKVIAYMTLKGAVTSAPAAALTARLAVNVNAGGGSVLTLANSNPKASGTTGGITAQAGGAINPAGLALQTVAGSPNAASIAPFDPTLAFADFAAAGKSVADAMFVSTFGMALSTYRDQPGAVILACAGTCSAAQVRAAADQNPGRILWINGDLDIDSAGDVGSRTAPLALVVTGNVRFSAVATVYGLVYAQANSNPLAPAWTMGGAGAATLIGAAMAQHGVDGASSASIAYDSAILDLLRYKTGSFVMVPGTWRDF